MCKQLLFEFIYVTRKHNTLLLDKYSFDERKISMISNIIYF
jgi:hypothetical protein